MTPLEFYGYCGMAVVGLFLWACAARPDADSAHTPFVIATSIVIFITWPLLMMMIMSDLMERRR